MIPAETAVRVLRSSECSIPAPDHRSALTDFIDHRTGASFATGMTVFRECNTPWTLWYDEVLFCHRVEGSFAIVVGDATYRLSTGDFIWLPRNTRLHYVCQGIAWVLWAVAPANWRESRPET